MSGSASSYKTVSENFTLFKVFLRRVFPGFASAHIYFADSNILKQRIYVALMADILLINIRMDQYLLVFHAYAML